jgi:hypothetical protein
MPLPPRHKARDLLVKEDANALALATDEPECAFGQLRLVVGPLVIALMITVLDVYERYIFGDLPQDESSTSLMRIDSGRERPTSTAVEKVMGSHVAAKTLSAAATGRISGSGGV